MGGLVGQVGFVILWSKPNPIRYKKKKSVTQPNPPSLKNRSNPAGQVGSGRVWQVGGFLRTPTPYYLFLFAFSPLYPQEQWNANHNKMVQMRACWTCLVLEVSVHCTQMYFSPFYLFCHFLFDHYNWVCQYIQNKMQFF